MLRRSSLPLRSVQWGGRGADVNVSLFPNIAGAGRLWGSSEARKGGKGAGVSGFPYRKKRLRQELAGKPSKPRHENELRRLLRSPRLRKTVQFIV